jgi:hypothetical protein
MAQTSKFCVDAAIAFADDKQHEGNGYHLRVALEDGTVLKGAVTRMDGQHPDVLFLLVDEAGLGRHNEVFVDKNRIVTATVIW